MINNNNYSNNASTMQPNNCIDKQNSNNMHQTQQSHTQSHPHQNTQQPNNTQQSNTTQPQSHLHSNNRPPLPSFLSIKDQFKTMLLDIMSLADLILDDIRKEIDEYNVDKNKYIFITNAFDTKAEAFMKSKRKSDVYKGDITENLNVDNESNNTGNNLQQTDNTELDNNKFLNDNFNRSYYKRTDEDLKDDAHDYSKNKNKPPKPTPQQILDNSYNELYNIHKQQQLDSQINNNNTIPERMPTHKELIYAEKKAEYIRKENVTSINTFMVSRKNSIVFRLNGISKIVKRISPLLNKYCHEEMKEMRMVREMMVEVKGENNADISKVSGNNNTINNITNNNTTNSNTTNSNTTNSNNNTTTNTYNTGKIVVGENNTITDINKNTTTNTDINKNSEVVANENNTDISKISKNNNTTNNTTTNTNINTNWNILYQIYLQCMTNKSNNLLFTIQTTDFRKNTTPTTSTPTSTPTSTSPP
ncbi:MAG: hypothetical protein Ta2D_09830 [Rickettsiales bacterium]|nr:MAG: hypothetical protein Ta2D_09830 [Rickettsiales bacterium]